MRPFESVHSDGKASLDVLVLGVHRLLPFIVEGFDRASFQFKFCNGIVVPLVQHLLLLLVEHGVSAFVVSVEVVDHLVPN